MLSAVTHVGGSNKQLGICDFVPRCVDMWRAIFLAIGAGLLMLGIESLALDHATLAEDSFLVKPQEQVVTEPVFDEYGFQVSERTVSTPVATSRTVSPPEWAPWSMLSSGAVIMLYSLASRFGGGRE